MLTRWGAAAVLAAALASCGAPTASAPVKTSAVDLPHSYVFQPASITVSVGTRVTWTNDDQFTHNIEFTTGDHQRLQDMKPGQKSSFTFSSAGTYHYQCHYHPKDMQGDVVVS